MKTLYVKQFIRGVVWGALLGAAIVWWPFTAFIAFVLVALVVGFTVMAVIDWAFDWGLDLMDDLLDLFWDIRNAVRRNRA